MKIEYKQSPKESSQEKGELKYDKISHKQKILLIKHVIYDRCGIKKIADQLQLNYSTAKTLIRRFKTRGHKLNKEFIVGCSRWFDIYELQQIKRCSYTTVLPNDQNKPLEKKANNPTLSQMENSQEVSSEVTNEPKRPTQVMLVQQVLFTE